MPDGIYDKAVIAQGLHLSPFRTEKLNRVTSMVLVVRESRKPPPYRDSDSYSPGLFFCFYSSIFSCKNFKSAIFIVKIFVKHILYL